MKIKVCGMKYQNNILDVAALQPDYIGFIFYKNSERFFNAEIPKLKSNIKKVGVFVNASTDYILSKVNAHHLDMVQLHGKESASFCKDLQSKGIGIIKVFSIKDNFNFSILKPYEDACDYFLFDTKGKLPGGNGYIFNWDVLKNYSSTKPYFLSGGIGLDQLEKLNEFKKSKASKFCHAVDVNSKFEIEAGLKNINALEKFKYEL